MNYQLIFSSLQILLSVLLVGSILLQQRGSGLGSAFGGSGGVYRSKRGVEKILYNATIVIAVLFIAVALASVIVL